MQFSVRIKSKVNATVTLAVRTLRMLHAVRLTVHTPILRNSCVCSCVRRVRAMSANGSDGPQTRMQKTNAKEFYCLTEKDVRQSGLMSIVGF